MIALPFVRDKIALACTRPGLALQHMHIALL